MINNKIFYKHVGHKLTVAINGKRVVLECQTCFENIADVTSEEVEIQPSQPVFEAPQVCNMDEGCEACGS